MSNLFKYNPTPWTHARCGDNWDINLPSEPESKGVGVVATVFAGEDIARLIAAAPRLYAVLEKLLVLDLAAISAAPGVSCDADEHNAALEEAKLLLAEIRGGQ